LSEFVLAAISCALFLRKFLKLAFTNFRSSGSNKTNAPELLQCTSSYRTLFLLRVKLQWILRLFSLYSSLFF